MKRKITYICDCSEHALKGNLFCEFSSTRDMDHHKIKINGVWSRLYTCPEHGGFLCSRKTTCIECGKEIYIKKFGNIVLRCPKCDKIIRAKQKNKAAKKWNAKNRDKNVKVVKKVVTKKRISIVPVRVRSVTEAIEKNINCIPLRKLFLFQRNIRRKMI